MKNSKNFILRIFLETKTTFSLFFTLHNFALVHEIFGRFFNIHRVKSIQKSLNYSSHLDSIVFDRCRSARARVSIFDEFRSVFRGNFEKSEKFRNGERRKFRNFDTETPTISRLGCEQLQMSEARYGASTLRVGLM